MSLTPRIASLAGHRDSWIAEERVAGRAPMVVRRHVAVVQGRVRLPVPAAVLAVARLGVQAAPVVPGVVLVAVPVNAQAVLVPVAAAVAAVLAALGRNRGKKDMAIDLKNIQNRLNAIDVNALKTEAGVASYIRPKTTNNSQRFGGFDRNHYDCGGTCSWSCSSCSGGCSGSASGGCGASCSANCSSGCASTCTGCSGCSGSCSSGCSGVCTGGCSASCGNGCTGGCSGCSGPNR